MYADVTVNLTLNCSTDAVNGAVVKLVNNDNDPAHVYQQTANTETVLFNVWKGSFTVTITKDGYETLVVNNVSIVEDEVTLNYQLIEVIEEPYGLEVTEINECQHMLTWNNTYFTPFFDDFESYDNFIIEDIGEYTLIDLDGYDTYIWSSTGPFWDNMGEPQAFMVFNPYATDGSFLTITELAGGVPHSGQKYLTCFSAPDGAVNDWVVLPKMEVISGVSFKFWAKTINAQWGLDRIKVGVSTTGTNAPGDFTIISTGNYISVPAAWTQYSFDLSAYAGQEIYIAINCVSNDAFMLMIDDISVDLTSKSKAVLGYRVYLDGNEMGMANTTAFTFNGVSAGSHTAGVQAVYCSGESDIMTVIFESTCTDEYFNIIATPNNSAWGSVTGSGGYLAGATVELKATPNNGYSFVNWTENGNVVETANPWTFTANANRTLTAVFKVAEVTTYTVTFVITDCSTGEDLGGAWLWFDGDMQSAHTAYDVTPGVHTYRIELADYITAEGEVTVTNADVTVPVCLTPVGIRTNVLSNVVLYPNPFKDEIMISNSDVVKSIQITNATGQKVKQVVFDGKSISTKELTSGIYFITIESITGEKVVHKMIRK